MFRQVFYKFLCHEHIDGGILSMGPVFSGTDLENPNTIADIL
jgi:hypothetical protein